MNSMIKVFALHTENSAVGWYRIVQPMAAVNKTKGFDILTTEFVPGKDPLPMRVEDMVRIISWADILIFSRIDNTSSLAYLRTIRQQFKGTILMEIDDYVDLLPVESPAYKSYNHHTDIKNIVHEQMKLSDGLICSTKPLADAYKQYCPKTFVIPNAIDFSYVKKYYKKSKNKKVVIGWSGGSSHKLDLELIKRPLEKFLKDNEKIVEFQYMGMDIPWAEKLSNTKHIPWVSMDKYYQKYYGLGWDIGLAPLFDSTYSRCKTNLRYLELSAQKIPTIASPVYPYAKSIKNEQTGFLAVSAEDWLRDLTLLTQDVKLRQKMGNEAYNFVRQNYSIKTITKEYTKVFQQFTK